MNTDRFTVAVINDLMFSLIPCERVNQTANTPTEGELLRKLIPGLT